MFEIKTLATADFSFAVDLANSMNWNMATEDFEFAASLEPKGCFLLTEDSTRVGIATCVSYGKVGWFGNLIVLPQYRRRGAGAALVQHAIGYLHDKGVETVGLYAYPQLASFYGRLGFKLDEDFSLLQTSRLGPVAAERLAQVTRQDMAAINRFDGQCFGGDRKRLLQSILLEEGNLGYCILEGDDVAGYIAATVYEKAAWIGPLVCQPQRRDIAVSLVKATLSNLAGKGVYAVVPKSNSVLMELFLSVGFKEEFFVSRMFLGQASAKNCIYMAESLERG